MKGNYMKGNYTVNASGVLARARALYNCPGHQTKAQAIHTLAETFRMSEGTAIDILEGRLLAEVDDNNLLQVTQRSCAR